MNEYGFVAEEEAKPDDFGFVPESHEDFGFVADRNSSLDESGLPADMGARQRKRLELGSQFAAGQAENEKLNAESEDLARQERNITAFSNPFTTIVNAPGRIMAEVGGVEPYYEDIYKKKPLVNLPQPTGTGVASGVGRTGAKLVTGLSDPDELMKLPAAELGALGKALFAISISKEVPEQVGHAIEVLKDPKATPADKAEAVSDPAVSAGMLALLGKSKSPAPIEPEFKGLPDPDRVARNLAEPGTVRPQEVQRVGAPEAEAPEMFQAGEVPFESMSRFGSKPLPPVDILPQMGRIEDVPILDEVRPKEQLETRGKVSFGAEAPTLNREALPIPPEVQAKIDAAKAQGLTKAAEAAAQVVARGENRMPPHRAPKSAPTAEQAARVAARESVEQGLTMEQPAMEELPPEVGQFPEEGMPTGTLSKLQSSRIQAGKPNVRSNVSNNPPAPKGEPSAPTITSSAEMDVRQPPGNGEALGKGNAETQAAPEVRPKEEVSTLHPDSQKLARSLSTPEDIAAATAELASADEAIAQMKPPADPAARMKYLEDKTALSHKAYVLREALESVKPKESAQDPVAQLRELPAKSTTQQAMALGKQVTPERLPELQKLADEAAAEANRIIEATDKLEAPTDADLTQMSEAGNRSQLLNEAVQAAQGVEPAMTARSEPIKPPARDWELYNENLRDNLDSFSPARTAGVKDYDLMDVADNFVEFAKQDKSGRPLSKLISEFSKSSDATPSQISKVRSAVKDLESKETKPSEPIKQPGGIMSGLKKLPEGGESGSMTLPVEEIRDAGRRVRDYVTIDPIPKLTRALGGDAMPAVEHAYARAAVPRMIDDLLARVFPEQYHDPVAMQRTMEVLKKDNILGGYDEFISRANEATDTREKNKWQKMADNVGTPAEIKALARDVSVGAIDPAVKANIERWNAEVNPLLDQLYNEMKGVDPETIREGRGRIFGARINLLPKAEEGRWLEVLGDEIKPLPSPSSNNFRNPAVKRDKFDRMAKFSGDYSDNPAAILANVLSHRWNEVTKLRLYNSMVDKGAAAWEKPESGQIKGEEAKPVTVTVPETKISKVKHEGVDLEVEGKTRQVSKTLWVPESTVADLRNVLGTELRPKQNPAAKALTYLQIYQATDAITHLKNLHSVVASAQGTKGLLTDIARKMPVVATADSVARIAGVIHEIAQDTPAIRAELADMAKKGMLREHFPQPEGNAITRFLRKPVVASGNIIHAVDTAGRVIMNRFYDNLVERGLAKDTPTARRAFVQQIGEYNQRLMGHMMRNMSRAGLSPFIVAGRNFNRFGRRLLTGNPGVEPASGKAALQMRLVNLSTLASIVTLPMIYNYLTQNSIWGRKGTPIGAVDLGTKDDEKGAHKVLDLAQLYGVRRGARATGIESIAEGIKAGESPDNIIGKATYDALSTAAHPWLGPALGAAQQTITGARLDLRGGPSPIEARKMGEKRSLSQLAENARVTLKNQNSLLYSPLRPLVGDTEEGFGKDMAKDFLKSPAGAVGIRDVKSPALVKAGELMGSHQQTPEQAAKGNAKRQLLKAEHEGEPGATESARSTGLGARDIRDVQKRGEDPLAFMVGKLGAEDAIRVWRVADKSEREALQGILNRKIRMSKLDSEMKEKLLEEVSLSAR